MKVIEKMVEKVIMNVMVKVRGVMRKMWSLK